MRTGARTREMTTAADRRRVLVILEADVAAETREREAAVLPGVGLSTLQHWRQVFNSDGDGVDRVKSVLRQQELQISIQDSKVAV